ncbi:alpha/beta hydrolase family protein [Flavobacterium soli]|uniref:alpha/beta hydrolase family protein n=1 Tax=Flavobacterium soli TaxID=344881 RepID=UPI00041F499A|nr:alpha/beta hydrolase [Flavobacterium soli]
MKKAFSLLLLFISSLSFSQEIAGQWFGTIEIQGTKLNLIFNIRKDSNGYAATMDSPEQGVRGIPINTVSFQSPNLKMGIEIAGIEYNGTLKASNEIIGTFSQGGANFPLNLIQNKDVKKRPQEPTEFNYYVENITFQNKKDNISLGGTLTLPSKEGKFPVVVLISGSGAQNRDSELLGHKSFLVIADYLTKRGIGVLRFDDRGVGESKGDRNIATTKDFATDVSAAVEYLKTRKEVNIKKIGLIGHSEGGIIAPMVAANSKDISYIVLLAGTGIPGDELLIQQTYLVGKAAGMSEEELKETQADNAKIYDIIKTEKNLETAKQKLTAIIQASFDELPADQKPSQEEINTVISQQIGMIASPWFQYFVTYNPSLILKDVKCPVLVLNGEKDVQVPSKVNTQAIKNALEKGGNKKVTVVELPNMNHLFQECVTCSVDEYEKIEQTFSPIALAQIGDWITNQVK